MNSELRQAVERVRECFDAAFIEDCGEWCALSDAIRELETITEEAEHDTMQADNTARDTQALRRLPDPAH